MSAAALFFYLFAGVMLASAFMVIAARNPVHSVLFLFVVMMLDVDFAELKQGFLQYLPFGALVGVIVAIELVLVVGGFQGAGGMAATPVQPGVSNTLALGRVLYTQYLYLFQGAGFILLTAMIGAIVLTLRHKPGVKRQDIAAQNARTPQTAVRMVKVGSGRGLEAAE